MNSGGGEGEDLDALAPVARARQRAFRAWWLVVPVVAVSVVLVVAAAAEARADPDPATVAVVVGIGLLSVVAVLVTVVTGLDYVRDAVRIRRAAGLPPAAGL